jgi:hypothetical protein
MRLNSALTRRFRSLNSGKQEGMSDRQDKKRWKMTAEEAAKRITQLERVYAEGFISRGELTGMKREIAARAAAAARPLERHKNDSAREDDLRIRNQQIEETLRVLKQAHPGRRPTPKDIAQLHDLHAAHEREAGHEGAALAAEARARHARALPRRPPQPPRQQP